MYIPEFNIKISKRIPNECSVYSSELVAILLALNWIRDIKPLNTVIFTDSQSSLISLQNIQENIYKSAIIKEISIIFTELYYNKISVTLTWIPSHVNIKENETVDKIAKETCKSENIQIQIPLNKMEINREIQIIFK
jgi:ribonuclease HI